MRQTSQKQVLFLLTCILLCCVYCQGQKPTTVYYSASDFGLQDADSKIDPYAIEVDSLGFAYIIGPSGVHRFNGHEFVKINQGTFRCTSVFKDANGRLWVQEYRGDLARVCADSLEFYPINDSIKGFIGNAEQLYFDKQGTLYLGSKSRGMIEVSKDGTIIEHHLHDGLHGHVITRLSDGTPFHYSELQPSPESSKLPVSVYFKASDGQVRKVAETQDPPFGGRASLIFQEDGTWLFSTSGKEVIKAKEDSLIEHFRFSFSIHGLFQDSKMNLWMGTVTRGLLRVDENFETIECLYGEGSASAEAEDENGGLWLSTGNFGIGYIPNQDMERYSVQTGQLKSNEVGFILTDYENIFAGLSPSPALLGKDTIIYIPDPSDAPSGDELTPQNRPTTHYVDTFNNWFYSVNAKRLSIWNGANWTLHELDQQMIKGHRIEQLANGGENKIIGITGHELLYIKDGVISKSVHLSAQIGRLKCFLKANDGNIWIGSDKGLWLWDGESLSKPVFSGKDTPLLEQGVYSLAFAQKRIWVQCGTGLLAINQNRVQLLSLANGGDLRLLELFTTKTGEVWGRTYGEPRGIVRLSAKGDSAYSEFFSFDDLAMKYNPEFIRNIAVLNDTIYLGGTGGVFRTPVDKLVAAGAAPIAHISAISANYVPLESSASHLLSHDQNTINIDFEAISFRLREIEFRLRLFGLDSTWRTPKYNGVQYTGLPPGEYEFQLQSKVLYENWGEMKSVHFSIAMPYWQTLWFRALIVVAVMLLVGSLTSLWFLGRQKRTLLELDRLKTKHSALRSQMDPHFVYNALNSAQKFLLLGKTKEHHEFMNKLTGLLRSGLENARLEFIPLTHELAFIENYLNIETQRFPDRFTVEITMDLALEEEKDDIAIPSMMIQPVCENAVKYAYNGNPVKITVSLKLNSENLIQVQVTDNGIGCFSKREILKNKDRESLGLSIMKDRIEILQKQGLEASINLQPLESETKRGTVATLILPIH